MVGEYCEDDENIELVRIMLDSTGHRLRGEDKEQARIENAWKARRVEPYEVVRLAWIVVLSPLITKMKRMEGIEQQGKVPKFDIILLWC